MRAVVFVVAGSLAAALAASAQPDGDFSGVWKLDPGSSVVRSLPAQPDPYLKVEQSASALKIIGSSEDEGGAGSSLTYPLGGRSEKLRVGASTWNTATKWEGPALLVNALVSGPENYTLMERWVRSKDGNRLTIHRTIVRAGGESESVLVYEKPGAELAAATAPSTSVETGASGWRRAGPQMATRPAPASAPASTVDEYVVAAGTRILMSLTSAIDTKAAEVGDRVYLQTAIPIFVDRKVVIPKGSYVEGTITEAHRAGRVKGRSVVNVRFERLTLPNGVTRDLLARASQADAQGNLDRKEGRIKGEGDKGGDARTVGQTTGIGAGVGTLAGAAAGHAGMGAGIGAAAGAAAGLAKVFGTRGADVVLHPGTSVEMTLDRDLRFTGEELGSR